MNNVRNYVNVVLAVVAIGLLVVLTFTECIDGEEREVRVKLEEFLSRGGSENDDGEDLATRVSYAGYVRVNNQTDANLFYWFFEAIHPTSSNVSQVPLIVWLQGGPGASSVGIGLAQEMGPFRLEWNSSSSMPTPVPNPYTWNNDFHMLFVDQPVGTGYSYVGDQSSYPTDETQVCEQLFELLRGFYRQHPEYFSCPLYIFGESYGGKYVPSIALYISSTVAETGDLSVPIPSGIGVGNGITDPIPQVNVTADLGFDFGLIDEAQRANATSILNHVLQLVAEGDWINASLTRDQLYQYILDCSGSPNVYDIRTYVKYNFTSSTVYFNSSTIKSQLHVPDNVTFNLNSKQAEYYLTGDIMQSVASALPLLLDGVGMHVLLYQGQFDARDGVRSNEAWIKEIPWSGSAPFNNADRVVWKIPSTTNKKEALEDLSEGKTVASRYRNPTTQDSKRPPLSTVAGFARKFKNLNHVIVVGAGHLVPMNQPLSSLDMVRKFIYGLPWEM